jgi:hypothetical protein
VNRCPQRIRLFKVGQEIILLLEGEGLFDGLVLVFGLIGKRDK